MIYAPVSPCLIFPLKSLLCSILNNYVETARPALVPPVWGFRDRFGRGGWGLPTRVLRLPSGSLHSSHMLSLGSAGLHPLCLLYRYPNSLATAHPTAAPSRTHTARKCLQKLIPRIVFILSLMKWDEKLYS